MIFIATLHIFEILLSHKTNSIITSYHQSCYDFPIDVVYTWVNGSDPTLLEQLLKTKQDIEDNILGNSGTQLNKYDCHQSNGNSIECKEDCLETSIVLINPAVNNPHQFFHNVTKFEQVNNLGTLIYFPTIQQAREITERCFISNNTTSYSLRKTHIILDREVNETTTASLNGTENRKTLANLSIPSLILLSGLPENFTSSHSKLVRYLSPFARKQVDVINIYDDKHVVLFNIKNRAANITKVIQALRMSFGKTKNSLQSIKIGHPIHLIVGGYDSNDSNKTDNKTTDTMQDLSDSRFADNQELRYSLRSIEKNADWIRNVFIVTNGQIPNWLNLENPRVRLITHEEIFTNKSHLPSFSSPAIESHLHRIPGLSKKFLYLNDDILLGRPIYPEDFYSKSKGYKVYLSWPVPNCADGCPMNWLKDGYCDQACNKSECLWDGGDCLKNNTQINHNSRGHVMTQTDTPLYLKHSTAYCNANCVDSWLSDRFCDQVCNNINCAFDLGDCGTNHFHLLKRIDFTLKKDIYYYNSNTTAIYFNLTNFISTNSQNNKDFNINEISYENNNNNNSNDSYVRSAALNMIHKSLIFLFVANQEKPNLNITLKGLKNNSSFVIKFRALVNDESLRANTTSNASMNDNISDGEAMDEWENFLTETYRLHDLDDTNKTLTKNNSRVKLKFTTEYIYPNILPLNNTLLNTSSFGCDFNASELPDQIKRQFHDLDIKYQKGILTQKGFTNFRLKLIHLYAKQLCHKFKTTIKTYDKTISPFDWERRSTFADIERSIGVKELNESDNHRVIRRHLMDSYANSLKHVNYLYNEVFGIEMRKVPAHMAHFIDVDIMSRLQRTFSHHFDKTSSHKIRSSDDMQFAFAYNYYLMSERQEVNKSQLFDDFDVDGSGTWSEREVRTVIINIYELPLKVEFIDDFYTKLFSCCNSSDNSCTEAKNNVNISQFYYRDQHYGKYNHSIEFEKSLVVECENVTNKLIPIFEKQKRNKFQILGEEEVSFKMIRSNATLVAQDLDQLSKQLKKFMCLNDNIDHQKSDADVRRIKQLLVGFYESIFPIRSQFELPFGQTNQVNNIHEYRQWKDKHNLHFKCKTNILWIFFIVLALSLVFIPKKIDFVSKLIVKHTLWQRYYRQN